MKRFRERNRALLGLSTVVVVLALIAGSLEFSKLPLIHNTDAYSADFASAGGLVTTDLVTVRGVKVGAITGLKLDGDQVKVSFEVQGGLALGSTTSAAAQVLSPIGTEYLELTPSGSGNLNGPIPVSRTTLPYTLVADLSDLGSEIQQYNIPELEHALETGSSDLAATSASETTAAFNGLARVSQILGSQSTALAAIVSQGAGLTSVLSQRSGQLFNLVGQADIVLQVLQQRQAAIKALLAATSSLSQELTSILSTNRGQLTSLLDNLQTVSAVLAQDSNDFGQAIPVLAAFSKYAANSTGSGAFADVSVPTLLVPDNVIEECSASGAFPSSNPQVGCRPPPAPSDGAK